MRMQVECPICNTKLIFEVGKEFAGRTVRVTCTGCDTPIDASTEMLRSQPQTAPPMQAPERGALAQSLANRMHASQHASSAPFAGGQQPPRQQHSEVLKYEVQCPHAPCGHRIVSHIERHRIGAGQVRVECPRCHSRIDCTLQAPPASAHLQQHQPHPMSQLQQSVQRQPFLSGPSQLHTKTAPAPLPALRALPKPMSAVRYIAMMIRNEVPTLDDDVEWISSDDETLADESQGRQVVDLTGHSAEKELGIKARRRGACDAMGRPKIEDGLVRMQKLEHVGVKTEGKVKREKPEVGVKESDTMQIDCSDQSKLVLKTEEAGRVRKQNGIGESKVCEKRETFEGLTHELVGDILMCWSMLRRLASHLTLPDLALETFVSAICCTPADRMKVSKNKKEAGDRAGGDGTESDDKNSETSDDRDAPELVRDTYQDDVYISLLYELCGELRRKEALVPSSSALNVHTWPEALRTYLHWMARHVYLISVGCDRDTQNERPDSEDGTEEGKARLSEMEREMQSRQEELLQIAQKLKGGDYSSLSLSERILVLSMLCNQLLHTGKFHQQVDQEENRAAQVRYSLQEMLSVIKQEESFSDTPLRYNPQPLPPLPLSSDADDESRAQALAARAQLEASRDAKTKASRAEDASKRAAIVKGIVRPSKALLHADGTRLPMGVDLKGTEVLINGLANGHELPVGVRRCKGVIFRTLMPGWHEVRRVDWNEKFRSAAAYVQAGSEDKKEDEKALLDPAFVEDETLRKLHQVKVKTAKLELMAEADRRCTVLTCREEPLGHDRHARAVMRWNGYLNEIFVQDQQYRWGVYRSAALERYMAALDSSQKSHERLLRGRAETPEEQKMAEIVQSESCILSSLRKVREFTLALKQAGGDVDAVADMMKPRETQMLTEDSRRIRNGELHASPYLQEEPGEIACAVTGETYNPRTHVHCPITFITIDKQRYNEGSKKKSKAKGGPLPGGKTWKAHVADLRELFAANPGKKQELRARLEARIPPEFAVVAFPQNGAGGGAGNRDVGALSRGLIKGYNDVIKVKDFDEVLSELKLLPTSDHLRTWHALAGPSVRDDIFHYLQMFELLEAIVDDAPLQRPRSLASVKGALMDMEAAIPEQAMPFWGDERREQWVYMVKYAASVEELLVAILYLEACIDRSWMKWRSRPIAKRRKMQTTAAQVPRLLDGEDEMEASEAGVDALEQAVAGPGDEDDEIMEVCSIEEEGGVGSKRKADAVDGAIDGDGVGKSRETRILEPQAHDLTHANPYQNFVKVMATELRITEPGLKGPAKMKRLGQLWQGLSEEEHRKWVQGVPDRVGGGGAQMDLPDGTTRSSKATTKDSGKEIAREGTDNCGRAGAATLNAADEGRTGGGKLRMKKTVTAVSTVNLDQHLHVTLVSDVEDERRKQLEDELARILRHEFEVVDVGMTTAGLASLVYLMDANFDFEKGGTVDIDKRQGFKASVQRTGTLVWLRPDGGARFPWPSEVCSSDQADMERNTGKVLLLLFATEEEVWVPPDRCLPFEDHLERFRDKLTKDPDAKFALERALARHEDILSIKNSEGIDKDTGMYRVPEVFEKKLRVGSIVEVEVQDPANKMTQWVPGKVVRLDGNDAFFVDIKIITPNERGSWEERYTVGEENSEWRWPISATNL